MEMNDMEILTLNLWDILKTKKIDVNFAIKYILFSRYKKTESEKCINRDDILFLQSHISRKELDDAIDHFRENMDKISI
jgi:hypothetical protein